jgi:hypothetical protein
MFSGFSKIRFNQRKPMTLKQASIWFLLLVSVPVNAFSAETQYRLAKSIKPSFQQITLKIMGVSTEVLQGDNNATKNTS